MRGLEKYKITCTKCGQSSIIALQGETILWDKTKNIISGRKRLDMQWGWQCMCGNNDIMTKQELTSITDKQNPDPKEIEQVIKNLVPQKSKFDMILIN